MKSGNISCTDVNRVATPRTSALIGVRTAIGLVSRGAPLDVIKACLKGPVFRSTRFFPSVLAVAVKNDAATLCLFRDALITSKGAPLATKTIAVRTLTTY
jgi:hypothetical protein